MTFQMLRFQLRPCLRHGSVIKNNFLDRSSSIAVCVRNPSSVSRLGSPRYLQAERQSISIRTFSEHKDESGRRNIVKAASNLFLSGKNPVPETSAVSLWSRTVSTYKWAHDFSMKFWQGTKDLFRNTLEARKLSKLKRSGQAITRKQDRFIRQNHKDLRSLVPFFLVWRIPLIGDFVLPIFIAKFPALLPSTFKLSKHMTVAERVMASNVKQISILRARPASGWWPQALQFFRTPCPTMSPLLVKLLHDTIEVNRPSLSSERVIDNRAVLESNFRLEDLSFKQLASLASILGVGTRVPKAWLLRRIRAHVDYLLGDDKRILEEGIASLSGTELQEAIFDRGMKLLGLTRPALEAELAEWLRISQARSEVILPLLIYAHAFEHRELWLQTALEWSATPADHAFGSTHDANA
eukprot:TRINITY_DN9162_c0_g1_i1.p1 TRINITY_DN9162_c0_g1~~TRINITY_DN9162_c0_g1_i1.p1  ORF type:complete len:410 (-),score=85.91 TRINITY_DN9162_c0_g1_i1:443-1672(-)